MPLVIKKLLVYHTSTILLYYVRLKDMLPDFKKPNMQSGCDSSHVPSRSLKTQI